jgi:excisionase family DNA binding protein
MKTYSTVEVSKLLGIGNDTLHRWIHTKKVPAPPVQSVGGLSIRLWTRADIEEVRRYKTTHYWGKGSRRRKQKEQSD